MAATAVVVEVMRLVAARSVAIVVIYLNRAPYPPVRLSFVGHQTPSAEVKAAAPPLSRDQRPNGLSGMRTLKCRQVLATSSELLAGWSGGFDKGAMARTLALAIGLASGLPALARCGPSRGSLVKSVAAPRTFRVDCGPEAPAFRASRPALAPP